MDFKEFGIFLKPGMERVEALIAASLSSDIPLLEMTNRKLQEHPGKRLRPVLALLVAGASGKVSESTYRYAAAAELLHNATLLHDDVVDGATERRGIPTVATLLNSPAAVLIGDFWLVRCLHLILDAEVEPDRVLRIFSATLGHLTEGEMLQLQKARKGDTTEEDYLRILYGKTASLFEGTALSAAISAGAAPEVTEAMGAFARNLGIAFQIKDDIFDYAAEESKIGKPVGIDLLEQKITQPLLCVLETLPEEEAAALRSKVMQVTDNPSLADEIRTLVREKGGIRMAEEKMEGYIGKALSFLVALPSSEEKTYLTKLARFVAGRDL